MNYNDIEEVYANTNYALDSLASVKAEKEHKKKIIYILENTKHLLVENSNLKHHRLAGKSLGMIEPFIEKKNERTFNNRLKKTKEMLSKSLSKGVETFIDSVAPMARRSYAKDSKVLETSINLLKPVLEDDALYEDFFNAYLLLPKLIKLYDCAPEMEDNPFEKSVLRAFDSVQKGRSNEKLFDDLISKAMSVSKDGKAEDLIISKIIDLGNAMYSQARENNNQDEVATNIAQNYKILLKSHFNNKKNKDFYFHLADLAILSQSDKEAETVIVDNLIDITNYMMKVEISNEDFDQQMDYINQTYDKIINSVTVSQENIDRLVEQQAPGKQHTLLKDNLDSMKLASTPEDKLTYVINIISKAEKILEKPVVGQRILYEMYQNFNDVLRRENDPEVKKGFGDLINKIDKKSEGPFTL